MRYSSNLKGALRVFARKAEDGSVRVNAQIDGIALARAVIDTEVFKQYFASHKTEAKPCADGSRFIACGDVIAKAVVAEGDDGRRVEEISSIAEWHPDLSSIADAFGF